MHAFEFDGRALGLIPATYAWEDYKVDERGAVKGLFLDIFTVVGISHTSSRFSVHHYWMHG
jgi:hypothetical protein